MKTTGLKIKEWLQSLSFRTGVIVLLCCIPFYILSFAQMLLPISTAAKGVLWAVLFGLAKTCQYGGLTILGVEGYKRLRNKFRKQYNKMTISFSPLTPRHLPLIEGEILTLHRPKAAAKSLPLRGEVWRGL